MIEDKGTAAHELPPVSGYHPQSASNIALVNNNKEMEERILRVIDSLKGFSAVDKRWLAIGRTHVEQAFMAINRAIFQPQRITLPEDTWPRPLSD